MLTLIESASELPVSLADAKAQLRVEHDLEDAYITDLIWAAVDIVEKQLGKSYASQTWQLILPRFCPDHTTCNCPVYLPRPPLSVVDWVKYFDTSNTRVDLDIADYYTMASTEDRGFIQPVNYWPAVRLYRPDAVQIQFVTDDSVIHPTFVHLVKIWVSVLYAKREGQLTNQEAQTIDWLSDQLRNWV